MSRPPEVIDALFALIREMKHIKMLFVLVVITATATSQTHTIDNDTLYISGVSSDYDVAAHTYYNTFSDVEVSWQVLDFQIPYGWEYSFCFPICYAIGVTESTSEFPANSQQYLNCHVYPNGFPGTGTIRMLIETDGAEQDVVTWIASFEDVSNTEVVHPSQIEVQQTADELLVTSLPEQALVSLFDLNGRLVTRSTATHERETISTLSLKGGLYILAVRSKDNLVLRRKIIIS